MALTNQVVITLFAVAPVQKSVISIWLVESSADYRNYCAPVVQELCMDPCYNYTKFNNWQQTINSTMYTRYDILRLHEKLKNRCLQFINCIGTSNTKSMLIINFPLYWSQPSFSREINWHFFNTMYSHRMLGVHVHSAMTDFSNCTLLLWADNLVQFFSSRIFVFTNAWAV